MEKILKALEAGIYELPNGVKVVITTPHPVNFYWEEAPDKCFVVPGSNILINAKPVEAEVGQIGVAKLITTKFVGDKETKEALKEFKARHPEVLVVGSIIAAQAYPGLVVGLVPAPGFERVPPAQKRMAPDKFNIY